MKLEKEVLIILNNWKTLSLPDLFDPKIEEEIDNVNITLFYQNSIDYSFFNDKNVLRNMKGLYSIYKYLKYHYPYNKDEYCNLILILFFDETYTVEENLDYRVNFLEEIIKTIENNLKEGED
jgi:hypothetical protein